MFMFVHITDKERRSRNFFPAAAGGTRSNGDRVFSVAAGERSRRGARWHVKTRGACPPGGFRAGPHRAGTDAPGGKIFATYTSLSKSPLLQWTRLACSRVSSPSVAPTTCTI
jgi:hypothetical protein